MKQKSLFIIFFLVCIIFACGEMVKAGENDIKQRLTKVTLQLRWFHQFQFAGYYAAVKKGFYQETGLDVKIKPGNPRINTQEEVLSGRADYGVSNSEVLIHRIQGKPVVVLAVIFQHSPLVFLTLKDSGIQHPQDMIGKRVGVSKSTRDAELLAMLHNEGVSPDSIYPPIGGYSVTMYYDGSADAASAYITNEPYYLEKKGYLYQIIDPLNYGIDFYGDCLFTSEKEISEYPERVKRFREASLKGWEFAMSHPVEIVDYIIDTYNPKKSRDHLLYEARKMNELILPKLIEIGHMNPGRWKHVAETFVDLNMIEPDYSLKGFIYDPDPRPDYGRLKKIFFTMLVLVAFGILGLLILFFFNRRLHREVSERKSAEVKLRFQAELMDQIQDAITATDLEGRITYVNDAVVRYVGKKKHQLIGKTVHVYGNDQGWSEDQQEIIEQTLAHGSWSGEVINHTDQGDTRIFQSKIWLTYDDNEEPNGMVGISTDVTEFEKSKRDLKESEERYRNIFNFSTDAFIVYDRKGFIVDANPAACRMYGYPLDMLTGTRGSKLIHPDYHHQFEKMILHDTVVELSSIYQVNVRKEGEIFHTEIKHTKFEYKGQSHILAIVRDITQRVQMENKLNNAKEEAEAANRAKSEFLANMSHEIRTPLNTILGFSEILAEKISFPEYKKYLINIFESGKTLLSLIDDILDLSKIEAGKMEIKPEPVNVRKLLNDLETVFSSRRIQKNLEWEISIQSAVSEFYKLDEIRIRQVLSNLVANAIKFTSEGRIMVRVDYIESLPLLESESGVLVFEVGDTGIGIPEGQQGRIFESFTQQEGQQARVYGGTGLGLTICKRLVNSMNGSIAVESTVGKGSLFRVTIPAEEIKSTEVSTRSGEEFEVSNIRFFPSIILVVDDEPANRALVKEFLQNQPVTLIESNSGEKTLKLLENGALPDLILMDLKMPVMDGYELTRIIKNHKYYKKIPVIALSAAIMKSNEERIRSLFDGYLPKPVNKRALFRELKRFLHLKTRSEGSISKKREQKVSGGARLVEELFQQSSGLIREIIKEMIPRYEEFQQVYYIDDILEFGLDLKKIAVENKMDVLLEYAGQLIQSVKENDIDEIEKNLKIFGFMSKSL